jgi:hypothetical protein
MCFVKYFVCDVMSCHTYLLFYKILRSKASTTSLPHHDDNSSELSSDISSNNNSNIRYSNNSNSVYIPLPSRYFDPAPMTIANSSIEVREVGGREKGK